MKAWLLLSQPPGCLCSRRGFGTLAAGPGCFPLGHGPYQPQPDCCAPAAAFGVWLSLVPGEGPAPIQCSTSVAALRNASPKAISGSTSYLQACLVFRSYPRFTGASAWTRIDRLASGPPHATTALFRLGFPPAPRLLSLNLAAYGDSQVHSTKGTPSPHKGALTAYRSMVSGSLSLPSRGPFHLSLTVLCAIGKGGPPSFRQDSSCPGVLRHGAKPSGQASRTGPSPSPAGLPRPFRSLPFQAGLPGTALQPPEDRSSGFGLFPFRSPLLRESRLDFLSCWYLDGSLPSV